MPPKPSCRTALDPRYYQIAVLATLLLYGVLWLDFPVSTVMLAVTIATALSSQWAFTHWVGLPGFDPRSPLISSLSLCLLLRSNALWPMALAALIAIASKFVLRSSQGHWFNPSGLAIVIMLTCTDTAWVSTGQWGQTAWFALLLACAGGLVLWRSRRSDISLAFLVVWALLLFGRAWWLGDPWPIPWRQLQSGALLIFAFFMISDPPTTPHSRPGRLLFAALVALATAIGRFYFYQPESLFYALILCSLLVPLINRYLPGERFQWQPATNRSLT